MVSTANRRARVRISAFAIRRRADAIVQLDTGEQIANSVRSIKLFVCLNSSHLHALHACSWMPQWNIRRIVR